MTTTTSTSRRSSSSRPGVRIRCSTRSDGDFHPSHGDPSRRDELRRRLVDLPWTVLDQRHGTEVVRVPQPGAGDGMIGDIAITDRTDAVLGCWVADCAPVVLIGNDRELAVAHAGWRGLAGGVIDAAVDAMTEPVDAALLGPTIGPCCYEFGADDLAAVAAGVGSSAIAGRTTDGRPALDVPRAVAAALGRRGIALEPIASTGCTGCAYDGFSHRIRSDTARHVVAVWQSTPDVEGS
ncbi:MAG: hypothetical protein HKN41_03700 [Ilumatobacter sp.]|nr:hypothetical protein [Ilumatobacter sp.]